MGTHHQPMNNHQRIPFRLVWTFETAWTFTLLLPHFGQIIIARGLLIELYYLGNNLIIAQSYLILASIIIYSELYVLKDAFHNLMLKDSRTRLTAAGLLPVGRVRDLQVAVLPLPLHYEAVVHDDMEAGRKDGPVPLGLGGAVFIPAQRPGDRVQDRRLPLVVFPADYRLEIENVKRVRAVRIEPAASGLTGTAGAGPPALHGVELEGEG